MDTKFDMHVKEVRRRVPKRTATEKETREFILKNGYNSDEYNKNRLFNMTASTWFKEKYGKTFTELRGTKKKKKKRKNKISWISEDNIKMFIVKHNYTRPMYDQFRIKHRMPCAAKLKVIYGKTFKQIVGKRIHGVYS